MEASITLKEVAKMYDNQMLLADLTFGIKQGSNFIILGKNGSGKSTILKIISGIVKVDNGMVYINGKDIDTRASDVQRHIGYSPQAPSLDSNLSLYQNIDLYARLYGIDSNEIVDKATDWLAFFNISQYKNKYPADVSFGVRKIISFIRSVIHMPDILVLDEPTMGLEPNQKMRVWESIDRHFINKTVLFTSQDFAEAEHHADQIAILHNGNIKITGTLDNLIQTRRGITKYSLSFKVPPGEELINSIQSMPRIIKPRFSGLELEFLTRDRQDFFQVLKLAIETGLKDMDTGLSTLRDLFVGYISDEGSE